MLVLNITPPRYVSREQLCEVSSKSDGKHGRYVDDGFLFLVNLTLTQELCVKFVTFHQKSMKKGQVERLRRISSCSNGDIKILFEIRPLGAMKAIF